MDATQALEATHGQLIIIKFRFDTSEHVGGKVLTIHL